MKNKNGFISMTLVYTFLILFLFLMTGILTSYNQRNKYYDIIEEQIKSEMNLDSEDEISLSYLFIYFSVI